MTTTHYFYNYLVWFLITIIVTAATEMNSQFIKQRKSPPKSIYQVLESKGLPSGLFPIGVTNFTVDDDGKFEVYLDQACDAKFESEIHYEKNVSGQLSFGQIGNLSGISAQDLFLWFPVKGIRVDIPSSGVIYFDVGVVRKQFSVSMFETPKDCVAASHPLQVVHPSAIADVLAKKFGGVLRLNWWKNGQEIM